MKKLLLIGTITIVMIGLLIITQNQTFATSKDLSIGLEMMENLSAHNAEKVVFTVNGYGITNSYINNIKTDYKYRGTKISDKEAYNEIIRTVVLSQEAERRGIIVSEEKAKEYIQETRDLLFDDKNNPREESKEDVQKLMEYLKGMEMSVDEYFNNPLLIEDYQRFAQVALLNNQLYLENADKIKSLESCYSEDDFNEFFEQRQQITDELVQELIKKADIVFIDQ